MRGRRRSVFNDGDPFAGGYWARQIRFIVRHIEEVNSPARREDLRREFFYLREHQLCTCGGLNEPSPIHLPGRGKRDPATQSPVNPTLLDLHRAHAAMPNHWRDKTRFWLLLNGSSEEQVDEMKRRGAFEHIHRSHVATQPDPIRPMPWRGTLWHSIAVWLNGGLERAA